MITIPKEIKKLLQTESVQKNIRITFPNGERSDICNDLIVGDSVELYESLCSREVLQFGLCESPIFQCEVVGVGNIRKCSIQVFCEIFCEPSVEGSVYRPDLNSYVYPIPYGMFTVESCKRKDDMLHRTIIAYNAINGKWYPPDIFNVLANFSSPANLPLKFSTEALAYMMFPSSLGKFLSEQGRTSVIDADHIITGGYTGSKMSQVVAEGVGYGYKYIAIDYAIAMVRSVISYGDGYSYSLNAYKVDYDEFDIVKGLDYINDYLRSIGVSARLWLNDIRQTINPLTIEGVYEPYVDKPSIAAYISPYMAQSGNNYIVGRNAGVNQSLIVDGRWHACMGIEYSKYASGSWTRYYDSTFRRDNVSFNEKNYEIELLNLLNHHGRSSVAYIFLPVSISVYDSQPYRDHTITPLARYKFPGARCEFGGYGWKDEDFTNGTADLAMTIQNDGLTAVPTETWSKYSYTRSSTGTRNDYTYKNGIEELSQFDMRDIVSAGYELMGLIGRFDRYGALDLIDLTKKFPLTPNTTLYPGENLKPQQATTGGRVMPKQTHSVWYDDEYQKPFGRVCCTFKNLNNEDEWAYYDLVEDYNSDEYSEYTLTDNAIIKSRNWDITAINHYLEIIGNKLKTVQYMQCTAEIDGRPDIEIGDTLELSSILNDSITAMVVRRSLRGELVITDSITSL